MRRQDFSDASSLEPSLRMNCAISHQSNVASREASILNIRASKVWNIGLREVSSLLSRDSLYNPYRRRGSPPRNNARPTGMEPSWAERGLFPPDALGVIKAIP